ncbi:acyl carrier protein [Acholeplasma sp. OttesenSCG-928-E16]|nr:acyl carrier protein [Acholeplasma sp. OttesenSCG-928-E16]
MPMVFEKVKKIIANELNVPEEKITLEASLVDDLGADSIDAVEVIMAIEDEFDIEISDEAMKDVKTIGDMVNFIEKNVK